MRIVRRLPRPAALVLGALALASQATGAVAKDRVTRVPGAVDAAAPTSEPSPEISRMTRGEAPSTLQVTVDHAKIVRLPERAQTVVVGNPAIADFAIQKNGIVVVTGKSFGITNLIALDNTGSVVAEASVHVNAPSDGIMVVQRGFDRQSYACTPLCQPSVVLGDSNAYFSENKGQADAHNQFATSR